MLFFGDQFFLMDDLQVFRNIQSGFCSQYESSFPDPMAPKTVVIIPSLTLDQDILSKIQGHIYYEERMLCLLMLLRMPRTHIVFVSSVPIDPVITDYYLHLLPGITGYHARQRLHLLSCYDASSMSLTEKILQRPRLIERIRQSIPAGHHAHMACFNVTPAERKLSVLLGIPIYGCDPDLYHLGTKSNSRRLFRECHLPLPDGFEDLGSPEEITEALVALKQKYPPLRKAIIKLNEGFGGEGNAIFSFAGAPALKSLREWIRDHLPENLKMVAHDLSYELFMQKFSGMKGIVEVFLEGQHKASPSVQCRINPLGKVEIISTHDQELCGECEQVFTGAYFPASAAYSKEIARMGEIVAKALSAQGVIGRFSVDFLSVLEEGKWQHNAIEINLRKGGTTHPYLMLQFLTDGHYDEKKGVFVTAAGQERHYYFTDNLCIPESRGLSPHDLIETAMNNRLHFDATLQEGVVFHLIGALSEFGKLGLVCIAASREKARELFRDAGYALGGK